MPDELEQYELHHRARIAIKPGITGMWQVSGRSDITDFEEIVRLDTEYISQWNIGLDIKILFKGDSLYAGDIHSEGVRILQILNFWRLIPAYMHNGFDFIGVHFVTETIC